MLASDLAIFDFAEGEGEDSLLAVTLDAVNPETFQPLSELHQGEEFVLLASVEDLRPNGSGVFGAYLDLLYPSSFFTAAGNTPLVYGSGFGNGRSGEVLNGVVDELGTFAASTNPPGPSTQPLAGIRLVATQVGEVQFSSNAADESPAHDILLFDRDDPVSTDLVRYGGLSLQILAPLPEATVDAIADTQAVNENSTENLFAVLENDKNTTGSPLVITGVDAATAHGDVTIANNGSLLVYTPDRGFVGTDQFTYTVAAGGEQDSTNVTVEVQRVVSQEDRVAYDLEITDSAGNPVSAVTVGDDFVLHVSAADLRDVPAGVFAAYLDVIYTSGAADVTGPITYGSSYANGQRGDVSEPGEIDEVGAFAGSTPLGGGGFEVFQIPFQATSPGRVIFEADPADDVPNSETLLYDIDAAVALEDIRFGRVALTVLPAVVAVDDTYELQFGGSAQVFAVLENDVNFGSGTLSVVSVDDSGLIGEVAITPDGRSVSYTPAAGFGGSEQFHYTISGPAGSSTAEVTVHVQPNTSGDDALGIRLAATDLQGNVISTVAAGQEFLLQAFVQDIRGEGANRGVYATYFDLLYERTGVHPVQTQVSPVGPVIEFGQNYQNGVRGDAAVPGLFNEIGAFQTGTTPLGTSESLLFSARFQAAPSRGESDTFELFEDGEAALPVLNNDIPNSGMTTFRSDPADELPVSDALFYDPVQSVPYDEIRYGNATIEISTGSGAAISAVSSTSAGGTVSIDASGTSLLYEPARNFNGVETFTYTLDGGSPVEVSVNVLPVNDAPVAASDTYRARENRVLTVGANVGVAANDTDVDHDALEASLLNDTSNGTLQLAADGSFTYAPDEGFLGLDSFTYRVTDGQLESLAATVEIEVVPRPVSIRLEAVGENGEPIGEVVADEVLIVRTLVQDLRSASDAQLGLGAVYLDIAYDVDDITPATSTDGPLGLEIEFSSAYQNGIGGELLPEGKLNDIGAFQGDFQALGGDELELFTAAFNVKGPRAIDDSFTVAEGALVNHLNALDNERDIRWNVTLDAQHASNSPVADVAYLDPAEAVPEEDIRYRDITLGVRNGALTIQSVGETVSGAAVSIQANGVIDYQPVAGFLGQDSFTYTIADSLGRTSTATITVQVAASWQNPVQPTDVNGDGDDSPLDALIIINVLNTLGAHELGDGVITAFLDVNGDGVVSPIDALLVINRLILSAISGEGELGSKAVDAPVLAFDSPARTPLIAMDVMASSVVSAPDAITELPEQVAVLSKFERAYPEASGLTTRPRADRPLSGDSAEDELRGLLETLAEDIAPRWDAFS